MKVVQPAPISLTASSVPEADHPAYDPGTTYALGDRVIVVATHRIYESLTGGNTGHNPVIDGTGYWLDVGPTNRWAMFSAAAGPATTSATTITLTIALGDAIDTIGLVDVQAASVRVEIAAASVTIFDETRASPAAAIAFEDLPVASGRSATVTITPTGGAAIVGKLITGAAFDLGTIADGATVTLTDFSQRETDAFGVTTIAERGWTRRIEAQTRTDATAVDGIQRRLAALRATAALWIGGGSYPGLIAYGFFKDFSQVVRLGANSLCSLTIDGLPAADIAVAAVEPAVTGASDFHAVHPAAITLVSSSVAEDDYPAWASGTTYVEGARVISSTTHRAYESLADGNIGNDPTTSPDNWIDIGPTNRWAMFDDALGTATSAGSSIVVQVQATTAIDTLALLDMAGVASVRVQSSGYDQIRTIGADGTVAMFRDLNVTAGTSITVTISGTAVSVGTMIVGQREGLGRMADAPTANITDFSVKETDEFGQTVPVERAWAKRLTANSLISTAVADTLMRRMARVRATPILWIGAGQFEALTIYGFFRDFSIAMGEQISTAAVTIEGMAKALPAPAQSAASLALLPYLTNDGQIIPADSDGNVTSYAGASGTFIIRDGEDEVQSSFTLTTEANPQGLTVAYSGADYVVSGGMDVGEDAASLTIKAVGFGPYSGITATKVFTLTKSRSGSGGAAAKLMSVASNRQAIAYDGEGAPTPTSQTITFTATKQNTTATVYWTITDAAGGAVSSAYLSAASGDVVSMTEPNFAIARNGTSGVIVRAQLDDGITLVDQISVVRVKAGATGAAGVDAINGFNRLRDTNFIQTPTKWTAAGINGVTGTFDGAVLNNGRRQIAWDVTIPAAGTNRRFDVISEAIPVEPGELLALQGVVQAVVQSGTCAVASVDLYLVPRDATGASINDFRVATLPGPQSYTLETGISTAAHLPTGSVTCQYRMVVKVTDGTGAGTLRVSLAQPMVSSARSGQTDCPPYSVGTFDGNDGSDGANGINTATIPIFRRAASAPPLPSVNATYDFAAKTLTGLNNGWTAFAIPAGADPVWQSAGTAASADATDIIPPSEWAGAVKITDRPAQSAPVILYNRTATATPPALPTTDITYTFATKTATGMNNGWTQALPATGGAYRWQTSATALGTGDTDTIAPSELSPARLLAQDGSDGIDGIDALSVSIAPSAIPVPCTANGTPKAALPGAQLTVYKGTTPVTATATYSLGTPVNLSGVSITSGGAVSVAGIAGGTAVLTGYVDITVTKDGASQVVRLVYNKALAGAAYVDGTANVGAPTATTLQTVGTLSLLMGPAGTIEFDTSGGFDAAGAGVINVAGTVDYSLNGGGSWTTGVSFTGNQAALGESGDWAATGSLSGATIGLTGKQTVVFRVQMRKTNTNSFSGFGGTLYVTWKG